MSWLNAKKMYKRRLTANICKEGRKESSNYWNRVRLLRKFMSAINEGKRLLMPKRQTVVQFRVMSSKM